MYNRKPDIPAISRKLIAAFICLLFISGCTTGRTNLRFVSIDDESTAGAEEEKLFSTIARYDQAVDSVEKEQWEEADSLFRILENDLVDISIEEPDTVQVGSYAWILEEVRKHREELEVHLDSSALFDEASDYARYLELPLEIPQPTTAAPDDTGTIVKTPGQQFIEDTASVIRYSTRYPRAKERFLGGEKKYLQKWIKRAGKYVPMVKKKLDEAGLPPQLVYLPMIESGYNPRAVSRAKAAGMWQFIASTARSYDLRVDYWIDERLDPEKSTDAAIKHIKHLHKMFGDWALVLAAYNSGEGRVQRAIRKQGVSDYLKLKLPRETRDYVPRLLAVQLLMADPARHGLEPVKETTDPPDIVLVKQCAGLDVVAECAGISRDTVEDMNPALRRWCTHPKGGTNLRLPAGAGEIFKKRFDAYPKDKLVAWTRYRVRKGDTISRIAVKYGTTIPAIARVNKLKNPNNIIAGKTLVIPIPAVKGASVQIPVEVASMRTEESIPNFYIVKKGDAPYKIAARYGIRLKDLLAWNGLDRNRPIYPGQTLTLHSPAPDLSSGSGYPPPNSKYTVKRGDSLTEIARKLGVAIGDLVTWNSLKNPNRLEIGQTLRFFAPGGKRGAPGGREYVVKKGDTVSGIAARFGISLNEIQTLNNLDRASRIYPGDVLVLRQVKPGTGRDPARQAKIHVVRKGDSLYSISREYHVSVGELRQKNNLGSKNTIYPGQKIIID